MLRNPGGSDGVSEMSEKIGHFARCCICFIYHLQSGVCNIPLCAKYNIKRLVFNNEIKMAGHKRNSAYSVFVLYDHFLRTNDEDVECSL